MILVAASGGAYCIGGMERRLLILRRSNWAPSTISPRPCRRPRSAMPRQFLRLPFEHPCQKAARRSVSGSNVQSLFHITNSQIQLARWLRNLDQNLPSPDCHYEDTIPKWRNKAL